MSHFYGTLRGNGVEVTRTGSKGSGMKAYAASRSGAGRVVAYHDDETGLDMLRFEVVTWHGEGKYRHVATVRADGQE